MELLQYGSSHLGISAVYTQLPILIDLKVVGQVTGTLFFYTSKIL